MESEELKKMDLTSRPPQKLDEKTHNKILSCRDILNHLFQHYRQFGAFPIKTQLRGVFKKRTSDFDFLINVGLARIDNQRNPPKMALRLFGFLYCDSDKAKHSLSIMEKVFVTIKQCFEQADYSEKTVPMDEFCQMIYPRLAGENRKFLERLLRLLQDGPYYIYSLSYSGTENADMIYNSITPTEKVDDFDDFENFCRETYDWITLPGSASNDPIAASLTRYSDVASGAIYIDKARINELKNLQSELDLRKLICLLEEINGCYRNGYRYAVNLLLRTLINHVPPIFGCETFKQVVAKEKKSSKSLFEELENAARDLADIEAHKPISKATPLLNDTKIDFKKEVDNLLVRIIEELSSD